MEATEEDWMKALIGSWLDLEAVGEHELAAKAEKMILEAIVFREAEDWVDSQICGDFPQVDVRCLSFCCSPAKRCPYRNLVLRKLGVSLGEYSDLKIGFGEKLAEECRGGTDG